MAVHVSPLVLLVQLLSVALGTSILIVGANHLNMNPGGQSAVQAHTPLSPDSHGIRRFDFHVTYTNFTRLCHTKPIATVNGQFPGPAIVVREGERVAVNVSNDLPDKNITIHWHGVRQLRSAWFDGPAYITQCPIPPGRSFVYNFTVAGQTGTLWWHMVYLNFPGLHMKYSLFGRYLPNMGMSTKVRGESNDLHVKE